MDKWDIDLACKKILNFSSLSSKNRDNLLKYLDIFFPPSKYYKHAALRRNAIKNLRLSRNLLTGAIQLFPHCLQVNDLPASGSSLSGYAVMLTAGGEGERLRISLQQNGIKADQLKDFTKATYKLPDFYADYGALHINLSLISNISMENEIDIPVIVTTGPPKSTTAKIIPRIIKENKSFGLKNIRVIQQNERLHLTEDEKIVYTFKYDSPEPVINPDETGGPVMKLKEVMETGETALSWLKRSGCDKIILLQATAIYDKELILKMARAGKAYDGVGVGIMRESFHSDDPYGTYVLVEKEESKKLIIVEKETRNEATRNLRDPNNVFYLPFNTGLYIFDRALIENNHLPDYATPPKEILPNLPRSPKIGYAATDILPFASYPAILAAPSDSFRVIKKADDLKDLSILGKKLGLNKICKEVREYTDSYK